MLPLWARDFLGDRFWHNTSSRQLFARNLERHGCSCGHMRCSILHVRYDVSTGQPSTDLKKKKVAVASYIATLDKNRTTLPIFTPSVIFAAVEVVGWLLEFIYCSIYLYAGHIVQSIFYILPLCIIVFFLFFFFRVCFVL